MSPFDTSAPVELQLNDYSCSVGATYWCLRSIGVNLTQLDLENLMVPNLVSSSLGLLDGSGAGIAALLRDRYGVSATNASPVSFDEVCARAGQQPVAIGGSRWYIDENGSATGHWVGVRTFDGTQLVLANPGGTGPHYGQQILDRSGFEQRGPFSAVWINAATATVFIVSNTGGQGANLRAEPSITAATVTNVPEGAHATGVEHAWRAVTDSSGSQGWMATDYLSPSDTGFRVTNTGGTGANLRANPSTQAASIKVLPEATTLSGDAHAWRQVTVSTGASGWIADDLLVKQS